MMTPQIFCCRLTAIEAALNVAKRPARRGSQQREDPGHPPPHSQIVMFLFLVSSITSIPKQSLAAHPIIQTRAHMAKLHPQTGPVTAAGKETSSRNATTHGGTSEKLIVAGERREDFDKLLNDLLEEHSPETPEARNLVEDAALGRWFLWRRQRAYNAVETALYAAQPSPEKWSPDDFHKLALLDRYKTAAERSLKHVLQNLASLHRAKKQRLNPSSPSPALPSLSTS